MKLKTRICDLLKIDYPVIQAGMGWDKRGSTTPPELVAAVSNAGGLGVIGGSPLQPELMMSVPGGQIAGLLGEKNVRPAGEILAAMVQQAAAILEERAGLVMRDA